MTGRFVWMVWVQYIRYECAKGLNIRYNGKVEALCKCNDSMWQCSMCHRYFEVMYGPMMEILVPDDGGPWSFWESLGGNSNVGIATFCMWATWTMFAESDCFCMGFYMISTAIWTGPSTWWISLLVILGLAIKLIISKFILYATGLTGDYHHFSDIPTGLNETFNLTSLHIALQECVGVSPTFLFSCHNCLTLLHPCIVPPHIGVLSR